MPDYVADVNTIADLKGKAGEFEGRIVGIEAGAGEMKAMREKVIPKYGLTDYKLVEGSSPAMLASLDSAIKQKQPIVVTLWQPHWAFSRYPLKVLDDPQSGLRSAGRDADHRHQGLQCRNPEAAGWLKNFKITLSSSRDLMLKIQTAGKGKEQAAAKQWAAENKAVVDAWFSGAAS